MDWATSPASTVRISNITETEPLISCVMPTYGRPDFVHESIAMFLAQDYPNKELIILNDCPEQKFECELPGIRVINAERRYANLGEKRDAAIELAQGELIAVWDDDDVYLPWRLSLSLNEMRRLGTEFYRPKTFWAYWGNEPLHVNETVPGWVNHAFVMFTKTLWREVGGYPPRTLNEDSDFFDRIHRHLNESFIAHPIAREDRLFVLRGKSRYAHISISGGENPLDLTPGQYSLEPKPIADESLKQHVEELIRLHQAKKPKGTDVQPLLSICIALKNRSRLSVGEETLELFPQCVRSLAHAAEQMADTGEIELVVADFQSDDWPLQEWLEVEAAPLKVRVVSLDDRFSRGKGLNAAVEAASSDHIFLCDADMLVKPEGIQRAIDIIDSGKAWFPTYQCLGRDGHPEFWQDFSHGMSAFHRELFQKAGPVPEFESWGGEDDLFHESLARFAPIIRERSPFLEHQWHPESSRHENYANPRQSDYQEHVARSKSASSRGESPCRRFYACHPDWEGEIHLFANLRMARPGVDIGSYELTPETLTLNWDRWNPETLHWDNQACSYLSPDKEFALVEIFDTESEESVSREVAAPLVAVVGLHSSGSSCVARVLDRLGLYFGDDGIGSYVNDQEDQGGCESAQLVSLLERFLPFPSTKSPQNSRELDEKLHVFMNRLRAKAATHKKMPAMTSPLLCQAADSLLQLPMRHLRLIHVERPLDDSIRSLQAREVACFDAEWIEDHQRWLYQGKCDLLKRVGEVLTIPYYSLLNSPDKEIRRIAEFLKIHPSNEQLLAAAAVANPSMRSV